MPAGRADRHQQSTQHGVSGMKCVLKAAYALAKDSHKVCCALHPKPAVSNLLPLKTLPCTTGHATKCSLAQAVLDVKCCSVMYPWVSVHRSNAPAQRPPQRCLRRPSPWTAARHSRVPAGRVASGPGPSQQFAPAPGAAGVGGQNATIEQARARELVSDLQGNARGLLEQSKLATKRGGGEMCGDEA